MKLTVTYRIEGHEYEHFKDADLDDFAEILGGPLRTGLDAANRQLEDEGKKLRLRLVEVEVK